MGAVLLAAAPGAGQPAPPPAPPTNEDCQTCHGDPSTTRANGQPVVVLPDRFAGSIHGSLACVDCHRDLAKPVEFPHPEKLAKVNCGTCHDTASQQYELGIHALARHRDRNSRAATCLDCHGGNAHEILPSSDPNSATNKLKIAETCATCHGNKAPITLSGGRSGAVAAMFQDSIHGQALVKKGLIVAPTCSDCHSNHDIIPKRMPDSPVARKTVPATCGKCHEGIRHDFAQGVHGAKLAGGNPNAPNCASCHTAHGIERTDTAKWQLHAIEQCGTCHKESLATYRDTFHGQVTALGFTPVAKCVDCHGPHKVFPKNDPRSPVHEANLVKTCGECHSSANGNFVKYNPHANKHDKSRLPALYYAARFMEALLVFVFAFFGVHTALWFSRGHVKRIPAPPPRPGPRPVPQQPAPAARDEEEPRG
jgi:nitrate/TMAO reductase-like tetraheme cytochrome c subunit